MFENIFSNSANQNIHTHTRARARVFITQAGRKTRRRTLVFFFLHTDMSKIARVDASDRERPWAFKLFLPGRNYFSTVARSCPDNFSPGGSFESRETHTQAKHIFPWQRLANGRQLYTRRRLGIHLPRSPSFFLRPPVYGSNPSPRVFNLSFIVSKLFREFMNRSRAGHGSLIRGYMGDTVFLLLFLTDAD